MRIDANGNVGIGTTAPGAKLEVAGTSGVDGIKYPDGVIQRRAATGAPHILIQEEQTAGTNSAGATGSSWNTRALNTEKIDTYNLATLSSNQMTLTAGSYYCDAIAPSYKTHNHRIRLRNVTDGTTLVVGTSERTANADAITTKSQLSGQFTIGSSKAIELQHYTGGTWSTGGLGQAVNDGEVEVYAQIACWKLD